MHTPEQAKKLWCPMTRASEIDLPPVNRDFRSNDNPDFSRCIASQCAMWRTGEFPSARTSKAQNAEAKSEEMAGARPGYPAIFWACDDSDDGAARWTETFDSVEARRPGYCGLAGRQP